MKDSEQRFRALIGSITDGILVHWVGNDAEQCRFIEANEVICRLLGYTREELLQMSPFDIDAPDSGVDSAEITGRIALGKNVLFEQIHLTKDKRRIPVEINTSLFQYNGQPAVVSLVRDITERKQAEARISRQNALLQGINRVLDKALSSRSEEELGYACLEVAEEITGSSFGFIGEIGPDGLLDLLAISEPGQAAWSLHDQNGRCRPGNFPIHGIYGKVIVTGRSFFTNDPANHPDHVGLPHDHPPLTSFLGVPLLRDARTIGMVAVANREGGFTPAELEALEGLAPTIAEAFQRKRAEKSLRDSEMFHRQILESIPGMVFTTRSDGYCDYQSQQWVDFTGVPMREHLGDGWSKLLHPDDRQRAFAAWRAAVEERAPYDLEYRVQRHDGAFEWFRVIGRPIRDEAGRIVRWFGVAMNIEKLKKAEVRLREHQEHLQHLAYHDVLTDLPNRLLFREHLKKSLAIANRTGQKVATLILDLDRFKNINDSLGHQAGDKVLREVADRLKYCLRKSDTVARLGGDEFGVILNQIQDVIHVASVARKVLAILPQPISVDVHELTVTGSLGISVFPSDTEEEETLLKFADAAMYQAKERGRNNFQFFTPDINARTHEFLLMENALRKALGNEQFLLHFQPQIDLEDGTIVGVEALLRWRHPVHGMVSPIDFIPLAEETGLIVPIGDWVLAAACRQAKLWQDHGLPPFRMAVNISSRQFREPDFVEKLGWILQESGLDPQWLELEITESVMMQNVEKAVITLDDLKARGISLSIDDFGTGYSSLSHLKQFPIHSLKIDRTFVRDVTSDPNDAAIASSVIALAHTMGLKVVGEGIETEEQLQFLKEKGCDMGQGYLFSRPLPAGEITKGILYWGKDGFSKCDSRKM